MRFRMLSIVIFSGAAALPGCASDAASTSWAGTVDTLATGQIVVRNTESGLWRSGDEWRIVEELRIGRVDGEGADLFGQINSFEVDRQGRIWVLEGQAQELRVFSPSGEHVRTVGRRGGGPGEFAQAVRAELGPDGNIWVMDPQNNRLSVIDSAGTFRDSHRALGGFIMLPWPGRFDEEGYYYSPVPRAGGGFRFGLMRSDISFSSADTIDVPTDPVDRSAHTLTSADGRIRAWVPFQGGLTWHLTPSGTFLALVSDQYRFFEVDRSGDTIRTITRAYSPLPVTSADHEQARESMEWFTNQGGQFDVSALPGVKPATRGFFLSDDGHIWAARVTADGSDLLYDVFDPDGRFLGSLELPFPLQPTHAIVRAGLLYGTIRDDFDVSYLVRARIEKP